MKYWCLAAAAIALGACGGGGDDAREARMEKEAARHGIDADVELDEKGDVAKVEIKSLGGATVGSNLALPADFPADVPAMDNWSIMAVTPAPGGYMVQALAEDDSQTIADAMRQSLMREGWAEVSSDSPTPQMRSVGFQKDGRMTNVVITENGDTRMVQVVTMKMPG